MKCLICHTLIADGSSEYHPACAKRLFGTETPPMLDISFDQISTFAAEAVSRSVTVPGVQPKLSLHLDSDGDAGRFTIVGLWGGFVLKPPVSDYPGLPENEDTVMHLADRAGIETVPHGMIRFASGELGYITRRIDRHGKHKLHMEDFCQLCRKLTHEKYNGSVEAASKAIVRFSANPGFDMVRFFSCVVFSFLVGNGDMHLKNYSLIRSAKGVVSLSPAYDLVSTVLAMPQDKEDTALPINGKKHQLERSDFLSLASYLRIPPKTAESEMRRFSEWKQSAGEVIQASFLSDTDKKRLESIIAERSARIGV